MFHMFNQAVFIYPYNIMRGLHVRKSMPCRLGEWHMTVIKAVLNLLLQVPVETYRSTATSS